MGYVNSQGTLTNGRRQSVAKAFLIPAKTRPNLRIIKHAFVQKILIKNNIAYGVKFLYRGKHKMKAFARKEIILSAGVLMSPHLLMLSGIGPRDVLQRHKIPVKIELPGVGRNLRDHPYALLWCTANPTATSPTLALDIFYQYLVNSAGPLTSIGLTKLVGFINTVDGKGPPDYEIHFFYFTQNSFALPEFVEKLDYEDSIKQKLLYENTLHDILGVASVQLHAKSEGFVELQSSCPCKRPIVEPKFFDHPDDRDGILKTFKLQLSYLNTTAYKAIGVQPIHFPIQECDQHEFQSDDYCRCYIKHFSSTAFHPIGTTKMGPNSDPMAVVSPELKVRNCQNLRVIDAGM